METQCRLSQIKQVNLVATTGRLRRWRSRLLREEFVVHVRRQAVLFFGRLIASREKTREGIELVRAVAGGLRACGTPEGVHVDFLLGTGLRGLLLVVLWVWLLG